MLSWIRFRRQLCNLTSTNAETQTNAVKTLGGLGNKRAVLPLLQLLEKCDTQSVRGNELASEVTRALVALGDRRAAGPLLQLAQSRSGNLAAIAGQALIHLDEPASVATLLQHFKSRCDDYDFAARTVGLLLAQRRDPRAVPLLVQALRAPDSYNLGTEVAKLGELADAQALGPLIAFFHSRGCEDAFNCCDQAICNILERDATTADEKHLRKLVALPAIHYEHLEEYSYSYMEPGSRVEHDYIRTPAIYAPRACELARRELDRRGLAPPNDK